MTRIPLAGRRRRSSRASGERNRALGHSSIRPLPPAVAVATANVPGRRPGQFGSLCGQLDASSEWIGILDFDGLVLFINERGRRALDRKNISCRPGGDWAASWASEWRAEAEKAVRAATAGQSSRFTARRVAGDGAVSWWDILLSPLPGAPRAPCWVTAVAMEMTVDPDNGSVVTAPARSGPLGGRLLDVLHGRNSVMTATGRDQLLEITDR